MSFYIALILILNKEVFELCEFFLRSGCPQMLEFRFDHTDITIKKIMKKHIYPVIKQPRHCVFLILLLFSLINSISFVKLDFFSADTK